MAGTGGERLRGSPPELSKETRQRLVASIKRYFAENLDEEIGDLKASLLLDYCIEEIGASIYNQAVADARSYVQDKLEDIENSCFAVEFEYWKKRPRKTDEECYISQVTKGRIDMKYGARNNVVGTVKSVKTGDVMSLIKIEVTGPCELASVMTTESLEGLSLKAGDKVRLIIKAVNVLAVKE